MTEAIEKDARGRFAPGNRGGPGRPRKHYEQRYQRIVYDALTPEALFRAVSKLIELAEQGDVAAIRELLRLALPAKPDPFEVLPDTSDA